MDFRFKMAEWKGISSSPPARAPEVRPATGQLSTGGHWNPPKKDTPHSRTKKKPQWDGGWSTITIKSNTIHAGWVTQRLENNNTKEVLILLRRFWTPSQASKSADLIKGLAISSESGRESQQDLITGLPRNWGKRDSSLGRQKQNCACIKTQRRGAVTPQETEPNYLLALDGLR